MEEKSKLIRQLKQAKSVVEQLEQDKGMALAEAKRLTHEAMEQKDTEVDYFLCCVAVIDRVTKDTSDFGSNFFACIVIFMCLSVICAIKLKLLIYFDVLIQLVQLRQQLQSTQDESAEFKQNKEKKVCDFSCNLPFQQHNYVTKVYGKITIPVL